MGAIVSTAAGNGAGDGGGIGETVGSIVGGNVDNGAAVGSAEGLASSGLCVRTAAAVGPGVSATGWTEGAGSVAVEVGLGDERAALGDGVVTGL